MKKDDINFLKSTKLPIYIWGAGEVGKLAEIFLENIGIETKGFVIDGTDVQSTDRIISKEKLLSTEPVFVLVKGFLGSFFLSDSMVKETWPGCQYVITISDVYEPDFSEPMTEEYYESHKTQFAVFRSALADSCSVQSLDAFLDAKITKTNTQMLPLVERTQYFFEDAPWLYSDTDILVEGGGVHRRQHSGFYPVARWQL
jgi:hypothetical protein